MVDLYKMIDDFSPCGRWGFWDWTENHPTSMDWWDLMTKAANTGSWLSPSCHFSPRNGDRSDRPSTLGIPNLPILQTTVDIGVSSHLNRWSTVGFFGGEPHLCMSQRRAAHEGHGERMPTGAVFWSEMVAGSQLCWPTYISTFFFEIVMFHDMY